MKDVEFLVPRGSNLEDAEEKIEKSCAGRGLRMMMKKPLGKFPGSIHWHYKKNSEPGTLELTLWCEKHRVWATIHDNRSAEWIEEELPGLRKAIERELVTRRS